MPGVVRNVLVVEDDAVVAAELERRLRGAGYAVELAPTLLAARAALSRRFDATVLDLQLPDGHGLDLLPMLRASTPALVLTVLDDERTSYQALTRGARGYLVKPDGIPSIATAVGDLIAGGSPISPRIARWLLEDLHARDSVNREATEALTPREREVVELFATGATYAEVARALEVSVNTVRQHVRRLYEKLHVCSKTEAVLKVMPHAGRL